MSDDDQRPNDHEQDESTSDVSSTDTEPTATRRSVRVVEEPTGATDRRVVMVLAVALATAIVAAVAFALAWQGAKDELADERALIEAGESAEDTAREMLEDMTTYSHKDTEFEWIDTYLTEDAAAKFQGEASKILQFVKQNKLVVTGSVVDLAHRAESTDEVVVLGFIDQTFKRQGEKQVFAAEEQRVRLNLTASGDGWKVAQVEILSGATGQ